MTGIRARLAEAHWDLYVSQARELSSCSHIPDTFAELGESEQAYHYRYVDVLLSLPGIAIVELPKPDSAGGITQSTWRVGNLTVETMGSSVLWPTGHKAGYGQFCETDDHTHNGCQPEWARPLAAALLAAANAAEANQ